MTIPAAFEVRLGTYDIDEPTLSGRAQVWALLEPHVEKLLSDSLRRSAKHAPVLTASITANFDRIVASRSQHLANLFLRPLDESWVTDAHSEAEFEASIGLDGRSRIVNARSLLSSFAYLAIAKHRFAPMKAARLIDVATRMLMLDGANGAACHKELEVKADANEGQELVKAVEDYADTVQGLRSAIIAVMRSLNETSGELNGLAEVATAETNTAAVAANDTAAHVGTTATAAEELSASVALVHDQATKSAEMAHKSVDQANQINTTIRSLSDAVGKIGSVVGMIFNIAKQTNLLALNATIEAARAGETGRGFSVVASEVKLLAMQTAKSTEEIKRQIAVIEEVTRRSVDTIAAGSQTISDIASIAEAVAAAVDEQTSATNSIAASAVRSAANAVTVTEALKIAERTISKTQESATLVRGLSRELSSRTAELDQAFTVLMESASRRITSIREFNALK